MCKAKTEEELRQMMKESEQKYKEEKKQLIINMDNYTYMMEVVRMIKGYIGRRGWHCYCTPCEECKLGTESSSCYAMEWRAKDFNQSPKVMKPMSKEESYIYAVAFRTKLYDLGNITKDRYVKYIQDLTKEYENEN